MLGDVENILRRLPEGYTELLQRVTETLGVDERVRALWVAGSVGRGVADIGSDLDLVVTVTDDDLDDFTDPGLWAILDPVITTPIPGMPGSFAFTTRGGHRVDVVVEKISELADSPYKHRIAVLNRNRLLAPSSGERDEGPDDAVMQGLVTEFLRQSAIFPGAVVAREDWLLGQEAVHNYRLILYSLFVEANQPLPAMGIKQWSAKLTPRQRDVLTRLPLPAAEDHAVIVAMMAVRRALRTEGRACLEAAGGQWPSEVDDALDEHWQQSGLA